MTDIIEINGEQYKKVGPSGDRAVVVLDRGWIFAGDIEDKDGRIYLTRVVWLFNWSNIGLDGVIDNPGNDSVNLKQFRDFDLPADVEIFRVPVDACWGLE